jgi:hypothetical protein
VTGWSGYQYVLLYTGALYWALAPLVYRKAGELVKNHASA